jgi:hypothetical protein
LVKTELLVSISLGTLFVVNFEIFWIFLKASESLETFEPILEKLMLDKEELGSFGDNSKVAGVLICVVTFFF